MRKTTEEKTTTSMSIETTTENDDETEALNKVVTTSSLLSPSSKPSVSSFLSVGSPNFKMLLLMLMVLQNSSLVLIGRYTRSKPKDELYSVNHLIMVCEVMKLVLSMGLEHLTLDPSKSKESISTLRQSIQVHILDRPWDALKTSIPALLYLLQNSLLYVALSNLTAPIFQVTYQCKLVTTALMSVCLLDRKYKPQQWICLIVLSLGVAIVVLGEKKDDKKDDTTTQSMNFALGLLSVLIACFSSALAGVYFEKVIKKPNSAPPPPTNNNDDDNASDAEKGAVAATPPPPPPPPASVWMRNMQLSFYTIIIGYVQGTIENSKADPDDVHDVNNKEYFFGFTFWVWMVVLLQAGGGLLVAAVIKYADNVLKGLATGVSIVVATTFSIAFLGTELSFQFFVGASMILSSVYVFSNPVAMNTKNPMLPFLKNQNNNNTSGS